MKKTDMELQAIREKLRLLESEPVAGDVLSVPWASPQAHPSPAHSSQAHPSPAHSSNVSQTPVDTTDSPQAAVMETLRKRSSTQRQETDSRTNKLVEQEISRLEVQALNINARSQQQATELLAMKRSAQQATVALRRQGIHHPQLDTIAQFLHQYSSATVPHLERDTQGQFNLSQTTVNLHHAEQEAINTAQTLRSLHAGSSSLYARGTRTHYIAGSRPPTAKTTAKTTGDQILNTTSGKPLGKTALGKAALGRRRSRSGKQWHNDLRHLLLRLKRQMATAISTRFDHLFSHPYSAGSFTDSAPLDYGPEYGPEYTGVYRRSPAQFSWTDGAIWLSAAAIVRIVLEVISLSYPPTRIPLMLVLFSAIAFSIYRVFVFKSLDLISAYRLGVVLLGLFIGSAF